MDTFLHNKRVWAVGGALAALLIAAVSWLLVIDPQLSSAAGLRDRAAAAEQQNAVTQSRVSRLRAQNDNIGALAGELKTAVDALPPVSGLPDFTREVTAAAHATGVTLESVTVGTVSAVTGKTGSATSATGSGNSGSAPAGIYGIPLTLQTTGPLGHQIAFLHAVQTGPRRALVTSTQLSPGTASRVDSIDTGATMSTQLTVFTAPLGPQQLARLQKLLPD